MTSSPVVSRSSRTSAIPVRLSGALPGGRPRERGAVLVHVAVAMMGLLAFSALAIDLGALWVARGQAQNAVDAAALAGAIALAGNPGDPSIAEAAARAIAQEHDIWGEPVAAGSLTLSTGTCPSGSPAIVGECMNVAVQRGGGVGTPLPVFFSRLFSVTPTSLRASASAKVLTGNTSTCLRPLAIMDRWGPAWQFNDQFEPPDFYFAPSSASSTGHEASLLNREVRLDRGEVGGDHELQPLPTGNHYFNLDVPRVGEPTGSGTYAERDLRYEANMVSCNGVPVEIGQAVGYWDAEEWRTIRTAEEIISSDYQAWWDGTTIRDSSFPVSPRLLTIALVDPQEFVNQPQPMASRRYVIQNLVGFFLVRMNGSALVGVFVKTGGSYSATAGNVVPGSSFLKNVALVR